MRTDELRICAENADTLIFIVFLCLLGCIEEAFFMFYPDFTGAEKLARENNIIPVTLSFYADMDTPISVFKILEQDKFCFLLESADGEREFARYSFVGRNPFMIFKSRGNKIFITERSGVEKVSEGDPIAALRELCERFKSPVLEGIPQFSGGAVGYFAYDAVRLTENLPNPPKDDLEQPDLHFMFTDELVAFDHDKQKLIIIVNIHTDGEGSFREKYDAATERLLGIRDEIFSAKRDALREKTPCECGEVESNFTREEFCAGVEKAKEYIRNGDIFQVVPSQRFSMKTNVNPFNAYRAIRLINPSPYMYYLKMDDYQIAGASPELLVRVENGEVQTSPIAGTRPRGKTSEEDAALERELASDEKENAEHVMLVDLGRNDIGKVCKFGSVSVTRFKYIQYFSHVMHMTSDVRGKLRSDKSVFDALCAALPAGTLSGAPKVRAMEIIDEIENVRRGIYGGAICYIGFGGSLDSCITIRTSLFKNGRAYVQAGGGIVYDSVPEKEYEESVNKSMAMITAIKKAGDMML